MIKYPLFGSVLANTKFVEDDSVGTAGTDGDTIYYSPTFLSGLNQKEQTFVLAHEICHIAFDHVFRSEGKDKDLWNIATDAVVNALLQQDGLPLVGEGVNIPEAVNYNAEQMYEKLLQEKQQKQNGNQGKPQENKNNNNNNQRNGQSSESNQPNNSQQNNNQNSNNNNQDSNQNNSRNSNDQKNENGQGNGSEGQDDSNPSNSQSESSGNSTGNNPHDMWEKAVEKRNSQNGDSQEGKKEEKTNIFERLFNRNKKKAEEKKNEEIEKAEEQAQKKKEEHIQKLTSAGEVKSFEKNKIARKKQLEELMNSIADESHGAGTGTNRDIRDVGDIGVASPLIDWRRLLKEAVKFDVDWSYENATIEEGVVTAHLEELPKPETEIVLDTSGSVDTNLLRNFLRECKNILQTSKVKVGCFDDEFYGFTEIRNINDIDRMTFTGGGGTNFEVAVNAFTKRVENKIIFTDGCARMPSISIDAIWVVFGNRKIHPKGGKVIYINDEQLNKLVNKRRI